MKTQALPASTDLGIALLRISLGTMWIAHALLKLLVFTLPGYTLTNFRLSYRPSPMFELLARVNNAFDKRYATYGALAETVFDAQGNYTGAEADALFIAPGTPRSYFVGLRVSF